MARLEELERKFEENPRRYFAPLANEYRKAGDAQRAVELCRSQLPDVPGHISGHIVLGQALFDARDFDGSRAAMETALALDPENIVALRYLGDIARDTGDPVEAERWYSRTLEADPYNEAATTALHALRAAQPAGDVAVESPEPEPATDSLAAGFEPTAHAEPEPTESAELPSVMDAPPPVEVADAGPPEAVSEMAHEEKEIGPQILADAGVNLDATRAETPRLLDAEMPRGGEAEVPAEPVEEIPADAPEAAQPAALAAPEIEPPTSEVLRVTGEFAGDLSVSTAPESTEIAPDEPSSDEAAHAEPSVAQPEEERVDVAAHEPAGLDAPEEAAQAEERVLESAAPFVTETMADLYLEQGYPHEALELLLQLSEQRPHDEELRARVEHIESVIVARRDAAVAAARAERAERAETVVAAEAADVTEVTEAAEATEAAAEPERPEDESGGDESTEAPDAPFDAAVAEIDSSAFAVSEPESEEPVSVRELFARMDRARPRAANAVTARPISRRRSDFVSMPEGEAAATDRSDDPFAFPSAPPPSAVPRTSGPQQTFNPSTADRDDFDAWLRGLRGP